MSLGPQRMRREWNSVDHFLSFQHIQSPTSNVWRKDDKYPADWGLPKIALQLPPSQRNKSRELTSALIFHQFQKQQSLLIQEEHIKVKLKNRKDLSRRHNEYFKEHEYSQIPSLLLTGADHHYESLPSLVNPPLHSVKTNPEPTKENLFRINKKFHSLPVLDCPDINGESEI